MNIGEKLVENIKSQKKIVPIQQKKRLTSSVFELTGTNEEEVKNVIMNLKCKKSCGIDGISAEVLREGVSFLAAPIVYLTNKILEKGVFPDAFKVAVVTPLLKGGDESVCSDYRPISLLSTLSKIVEKIIKIRITNYFRHNSLHSDMQFGFTEGRSTQGAIAALTAQIYDAFNSGKVSLCVFVDLMKAFDTVEHKTLLGILEGLGFQNSSFNLIESYLSGRTQCVKVGEHDYSEQREIKYGVPQGSVLGPLLFCAYVDGLLALNTYGKILSYADDTAVFYTGENWQELVQKVERDFCRIDDWMSSHLLSINYNKTKCMPFAVDRRSLPSDLSIRVRTVTQVTSISSTTEYKYLGVTLDSFLKWNIHVESLVIKLRGLIWRFRRLSSVLDLQHLKVMYYALVESLIRYGIVGWGGAYNNILKKLEIQQKWFIKIIFKKNIRYPTEALFNETGLWDIRKLYCWSVLGNIKLNMTGQQMVSHGRHTRYSILSVVIPKVQRTIFQRSHSFLGPRIYSALPVHIKMIVNIKKYKKEIKKWISSKSKRFIENIVDLKNFSGVV